MKGLVTDTILAGIGNAIRTKTGKADKIKVSSMASEILSINTTPKYLLKQPGGSIRPVNKFVRTSSGLSIE